MARPQSPISVSVGDLMPRITLPSAFGGLFDSWDPMTSGQARVYWLGAPPSALVTAQLVEILATCETMLHFVAAAPPADPCGCPSWLVDRGGELGRAFAASENLAIVVDAAGQVAALLPRPTPDDVAAVASRLYGASTPDVVQAKAPVLLLERVVEPSFCQALVDYWQRGHKVINKLGSSEGGNVVNADVKRRHDVQLDEPKLFVQLRDRLVRRVAPMIHKAFHTLPIVIEAPIIGCYDAASGGWFRRHRDNTTRRSSAARRCRWRRSRCGPPSRRTFPIDRRRRCCLASAQLGVAIANQFPQVTLTAGVNTTSVALDQLFGPGVTGSTVGASVLQTVLDGGALWAKKKAAQAQLEQADAQYRSTVLAAFRNVADTLRSLEYDALTLRAAVQAERAAQTSYTIARRRLELGDTTYVVVLIAELAYQQAQLNRIQAQASRFTDTAALFQALGGGWWNRDDQSSSPTRPLTCRPPRAAPAPASTAARK